MNNFTPPPSNQSLPPLEQLRDIHLPEPIPPSPFEAETQSQFIEQIGYMIINNPSELPIGIWILLGIILITPCLLIYILWRRYQKSAYRREALKELKQLEAVCDDSEFCNAVARLLKAVVIRHIDPTAATRFGEAWQQQLQKLYPQFEHNSASALTTGQYQNIPAINKQVLYKDAHAWIRKHHA